MLEDLYIVYIALLSLCAFDETEVLNLPRVVSRFQTVFQTLRGSSMCLVFSLIFFGLFQRGLLQGRSDCTDAIPNAVCCAGEAQNVHFT